MHYEILGESDMVDAVFLTTVKILLITSSMFSLNYIAVGLFIKCFLFEFL